MHRHGGTAHASTTLGMILCALLRHAASAAPDARIFLPDSRTCVFAGATVEIPVQLIGDDALTGRLGWALVHNRHTLARHEQAVAIQRGQPGELRLKLDLPAARENIILDCRLELNLIDRAAQPRAPQTRPLTIFPPDPFTLRRRWVERLDLHVFDPGGDTHAAFTALGIPYRRIERVDSIDHLTGGVLIIGEGIALSDYPGLAPRAMRAARGGTPVILLAPADGDIEFPGTTDDPDGGLPTAVSFRERDVIREFDKRFDVAHWRADRESVAVRFKLAARGEQTALRVNDQDGWPWIEFQWPGNKRLVIVGFGMIRDWEDSPVPRYLLARVLDVLTRHTNRESAP